MIEKNSYDKHIKTDFTRYGFISSRRKSLTDNKIIVYLIGELLLYFVVSFLFFFMIFFVNQILLLAESILQKRVPIWDAVKLISYCLPFIIAQSSPFATLVGFLMCIGRMVSSNEILVMRASGISYKIILLPIFLVGLLISVVSFFVNDYLLPLGTMHYTRLYRSILLSNPSVEIEPNSIKRTNDSTLVIGDVENSTVSDLIIFDTDDDSLRIITAGKSNIEESNVSGVAMQMDMTNAFALFLKKNKKTTFDVLKSEELTFNVFESSFFDFVDGVSPREMTSYDLYKQLKTMKTDPNVHSKVLNQYVLEYNKKFSTPMGALFFALLAMPLAILFGKHNGQTIGLIIGLFISVIYWAMMILGQIFASKSGQGGFINMWFPNFTVAFFGFLFYIVLVKK